MNPQRIEKLQLINTLTQQPITGYDSLPPSIVLNLATLPKFTIKAITNPTTVGSVLFDLDGNRHIEDTVPYSINGDNSGTFISWMPSVGQHTVTVTPYTQTQGKGIAGTPLTIVLSVMNTSAPQPTIPAFTYGGNATIVFDGQNFSITIKGKIQP